MLLNSHSTVELKEENRSSPIGAVDHRKGIPLEVKPIVDAIVDLSICQRHLRMYPAEHLLVKQGFERAHTALRLALETTPEITIGVVKDTFLIDGHVLDTKNPMLRQFALALKRRTIAALTLFKGVEKQELLYFLNMLGKSRDDSTAAGEPGAVKSQTLIPCILIWTVDYSKFRVTEEEGIADPHRHRTRSRETSLWQDFVTRLLSGTIPDSEGDLSLEISEQGDPFQIAQLLNLNHLDSGAALQIYENILNDHIREMSEGAVEYCEDPASLTRLDTLLHELNPRLRQQFLSVTFQQCAPVSDSGWTEEFLRGLSYRLVLEMLRQANAEGKEISMSLLRLLHRIAIRDASELQPVASTIPPSSLQEEPQISAEDLQTLFESEDRQKYVIKEYDEMLHQLTVQPRPGEACSLTAFPLEEHLKTLESSHLSTQISRLLLSYMSMDIAAEEYRVYADKFVPLAYDLLEAGNFALLNEFLKNLHEHQEESQSEDVQLSARQALGELRKPAFVSKAVAAFWKHKDGAGEGGLTFLVALGPGVVTEILNLWARQDGMVEEDIMAFLAAFPHEAALEAQKLLSDQSPEFVRNLVIIFRKLNLREATANLRLHLTHRDETVRMETLTTLLEFGDQMAHVFLRRALHSPHPNVVSQGISLAGKYRIAEVVPDLIAVLKRRALFRSAYKRKVEIVTTLGQIGDPRAIPVLKEIVGASWTLYPGKLSELKLAVFASLDGYRYDDIRVLLALGVNATQEKIRSACRRISTEKGLTQE